MIISQDRVSRCCPRHVCRSRRSARCLLVLLVVVTHAALWDSAVTCNAALSIRDAASFTSTQAVASLTSTVPSDVLQRPLPVYGGVVNASVTGVYCVDEENQVLYTGSNVLHVFAVKQETAAAAATAASRTALHGSDNTSAEPPAYYFEPAGTIPLHGWATACLFVNRHELYIATTVAQNRSSTLWSPFASSSHSDRSTTVTDDDVGHFYTVIQRGLRQPLRLFATSLPKTKPTALLSSDLRSGLSVMMRAVALSGFATPVVTPIWDGYLVVEYMRTPLVTVQFIRLDAFTAPQSVVEPVEGQRHGNTSLYVLTYTALPAAANTSAAASPLHNYAWDIKGIILPAENRDPHLRPEVPATVSEHFARCYASRIAEQCSDCFPVAVAASQRGLVVALTSHALNATFTTLLPSGTACTMGGDETTEGNINIAAFDEASSHASAPELSNRHSDTQPTDVVPVLSQRRSAYDANVDTVEEDERTVELVRLAASVCKVPAMVVDDFAALHIYVTLDCPEVQDLGHGLAQRFLVRVEIAAAADSGRRFQQVLALPVRQPIPLYAADTDDGTEEVVSLVLSNASRLLYLAMRRADATIRVYTYAAFGISSLNPCAVVAVGGTPTTLRGFGLLPAMQCVFGGADDAVVSSRYHDKFALDCVTPPLLGKVCVAHPVMLRLPCAEPWAVPSRTPYRAVVSPTVTLLSYVPQPEVYRVVNEMTGASSGENGTNITVLVMGRNFVNGSKYGLQSKCFYWSARNQAALIASAPATFVNESTVKCTFLDLHALSSPTFVSYSVDGHAVTQRSASFSVRCPLDRVRVRVGIFNSAEAVEPSATVPATLETHQEPAIRSSRYAALPRVEAQLADVFSTGISRPESMPWLHVHLLRKQAKSAQGGPDEESSDAESDTQFPSTRAVLSGSTVQPVDEDGKAVFTGLALVCPLVGNYSFYFFLGNHTHILREYDPGVLRVHVWEGVPYAPVFVGWPSTSYYPDTLLQHQPVVGVQDVCGNVYSYLNESVLDGPLTVQLEMERIVVSHEDGTKAFSRKPFGEPWSVSAPLNNLFYISNISFPAHSAEGRFYINITCTLPQPALISPPIVMVPCESDRQNLLTAAAGSTESAPRITHSETVCGPCPSHGVCDGTSTVRTEDGYWRVNASTTAFVSCRAGYGTAKACVKDGQCAPGYEGVLCGECADGYHTLGRACRKCLPRGVQGFLAFLVVLGMVLIMTIFVVLMALIPPNSLGVLSIRSLLLAVQIASLFVFISVPWPSQLETFFNGLYGMAEAIETMVSCSMSPQGYLIFLACSPLVLVPLVTVLAGGCLWFVKLHRVDPYRLCAVVLMALLHRKQERFHQLRHTIAQELAEQGGGGGGGGSANGSHNAAFSERGEAAGMRESYSGISASATRLSLSAEWAAQERHAASSYSPAPLTDSMGAMSTTTTSAAAGAAAVGVEGAIVDAFATHTAAVLARLAAAAGPEATWEQLVVRAMQDGNAELLSCVREMRAPLLTRRQVEEWAAHTTDIVVGVRAKQRSAGDARGGDESANSSSKSTNTAREARGTAAAAAKAKRAMLISWQRVGMIGAYREMAVHQFRRSWTALLTSTASVVLVCYYLPLILNAFLWLQCIKVEVWPGTSSASLDVPVMATTLSCASPEYRAMRKLAIAMLVVYGLTSVVALLAVAVFLERRYGDDVMYAALPVIFFGDSAFDFYISLTYLLTKLVAVIAVTQADSPMLQISVLAAFFALAIFFNSMWSVSGQSVMLRCRYLTITLRSVLTASRVLFLLVCNILLLLAYLIVSGFELSPSGERGFVAISTLGISAVFAMFTAVTLHQFATHLRYARHYGAITAKREREEQQHVETLVRRYVDIGQTIELYLKVCERGLAAAQKLDTLSRYTHLPDDDAATVADENLLSFSSRSGAVENGSADGDEDASSTNLAMERERERGGRGRTTTNTPVLAAEAAPEALTRFSPYPALSPSDYPLDSGTTAAKRRTAVRRRTAAYLSTAFRASSGSQETNATSLSTYPSQRGRQADAPTSLRLLVHAAGYADGDADFAAPVEGNANWVSAPRRGATALTGDRRSAGRGATPNGGENVSNDGVVVGVGAAGVGAGTTAANTPAAGAAVTASNVNTRAGSPSLPEFGAATRAAAAASPDKFTIDAAHVEDAERQSGVDRAHATPPPLLTSPDLFSGDFTEVRLPIAQPPLRRCDSLLLSIRSFDIDFTAKAQKSRDDLMRESSVVAMAAYEKARQQPQQQYPRGSVHMASYSGERGESVDGVAAKVNEPAGGPTPASATDTAPRPAPGGPVSAATIEAFAPVTDLDLASSFDPLAVPPLPLTRALSRLRPTPSTALNTSAVNTTTKDSVQGLLAGLQGDLEEELRQLNVMPLHDSLLGIDLGQVANVSSLLQHAHPISFWGGNAALNLIDSAAPFSAGGRSRTTHMATTRGGATQTAAAAATLPMSKSLTHDNNATEATAVSPTGGLDHTTKLGSEGPPPNAANGAPAPARRSGGQTTHAGSGSVEGSDDVTASGDVAAAHSSATTMPPPLPQFHVPQTYAHGSHCTAAEYMRRRAARTSRAQRSRSGGQNVSRSRTKRTVAGTPQATQDSKKLHSTEAKPKLE
ncbi:transmembrane protein [Lotmaria passim]